MISSMLSLKKLLPMYKNETMALEKCPWLIIFLTCTLTDTVYGGASYRRTQDKPMKFPEKDKKNRVWLNK